jgi:hypothetical protein
MRFLPWFFLFLGITILPAQQAGQGVGFVRFVNAVGVEGKLDIRMEGSSVREGGFAPGDMTGGVGLTEGSHRFAFAHPGCSGAEMQLKVEPRITRTVVLVHEEKKNKDGEVVEKMIKAREFPARERDRKSSVTLYSFSTQPVLTMRGFINNKLPGQDIVLKTGESTVIHLPASGDFLLGLGQAKLLALTLEDPGHYAAVVFDDPAKAGTVRVVYFLNETFEVGG